MNTPPGIIFLWLAGFASLAGSEMFRSRLALSATIFFGLAAVVVPILAALRRGADVSAAGRRGDPSSQDPRP